MCNELGYVIEAIVRRLQADPSVRSLDEVVLDVRPFVCRQPDADRHRVGLARLTDHEVLEKRKQTDK